MRKIPVIIVGLQWGDEGKGKIVDYLSKNSDIVVRFNGGDNAGHTVVVDDKVFKFHNLPSGAAYEKKILIAQGEVINPKILLSEIEIVKENNLKLNLGIDYRTHIVMPYHQLLDSATEKWKGKNATGSLKLGIGYCYEDKNNRLGIRLEDLIRPHVLSQKVKNIFPLKKSIIEKVFGQKVNVTANKIIKEYIYFGYKLKSYACDVSFMINTLLGKKKMIFESAHGTFLDPVFGTYPYTVAPHCISAAAFTGIGIGPTKVKVMGIMKAYTTRVGNGSFPTEQKNQIGEKIQKIGCEVGTTSGRKRRCGWLDLPMLRTAIQLNGCTELSLTKLDVLSTFTTLKIATHYEKNKKLISYFPAQMNELSDFKPRYITLPGWQSSIEGSKKYSDLPFNCRKYIEYLEKELNLQIRFISIGAQRKAIIKH